MHYVYCENVSNVSTVFLQSLILTEPNRIWIPWFKVTLENTLILQVIVIKKNRRKRSLRVFWLLTCHDVWLVPPPRTRQIKETIHQGIKKAFFWRFGRKSKTEAGWTKRRKSHFFHLWHSWKVADYGTTGYKVHYCSFVMCCHYNWGLKAHIFWGKIALRFPRKANGRKKGEAGARIFWHNSHLATLSRFHPRLVRMWRWWSITVGVKWASAVRAGCADAKCNHWNCILRGQKWGYPILHDYLTRCLDGPWRGPPGKITRLKRLLQTYIVSPRAGVVQKLKFQVHPVLQLKSGSELRIYITSLMSFLSFPYFSYNIGHTKRCHCRRHVWVVHPAKK